ncbi:uncharacterized protein LOC107222648 [Neodiprion lecontei]|uniref:Uncharacterized protein LOC107222648 n=1 Tax=Neodiprion lecontei TaxID=441921 RepID=A0A6J0BSW9_NEOLC|nr:uncharacterized protein LOC107222648 [Neodiprion lecontei]
MTSYYKTPSRNCPSCVIPFYGVVPPHKITALRTPLPRCCPQKCSSVDPTQFANGQLQVPINLTRNKPAARSTNQGPRRFSGRDWRDRIQGFQIPGGNLNPNPTRKEPRGLGWYEGPGSAEKEDMTSEFGSVGEIAQTGIGMIKRQYEVGCAEVGAAIKYLKHLWMTTDGSYSEKAQVVNRMMCFYLILLGIYLAETAFWVDRQLFDGLCTLVLKPKSNTEMLTGVAAVVVIIFVLYLIGAPPSSPEVCTIGS